MPQVTSEDGTSIAYDRQGAGPAMVLVGGGLVDPVSGRPGRWENAPLAAALAERFTVYNYDRRGRGDSGDTLPYAVDRELEDLRALLDQAGGSACLCGVSSGGALALQAAAAGLSAERVAVYEVPYFVAGEMVQRWRDYVEQLTAALAGDRRGDAVELFMRVAGAEDDIPLARRSPMWPGLEAVAHTLAYDAACLGDGRPPTGLLAAVTQPTLHHRCGIYACWNPDHLEPVTHAENQRHKRRTHCKHGHSLSGDNLRIGPNGGRACRACNAANQRAFRERQAAGRPDAQRP